MKIALISGRSTLGRLWRDYMRVQRGRLALALLFMAIVGGTTAATVQLIEPTLDLVFVNKDDRLLLLLVLGFILLLLLRGISNFIQTVLLQDMGMQVVRQLQEQMFAALQEADLQYIHDQGTGRQLSRFTNDVAVLREALSKVFTGAGRDLLTVIALTGLMIYTDWRMSLVAVLFFPLSLYPIRRIGRRLRNVAQRMQEEVSRMTAMLDDSLKGMRQVKAYNRQAHETARTAAMFEKTRYLNLKAVQVRSLTYPILDGLSGLTTGGVILWGGTMILGGHLTVGQFMTFFIAVFAAYQPMRSLANLNASLQEGLAAAQRVFELVDHIPGIRDKPDARPFQPGPGAVELRGVSFSYGSGENRRLVLRDVNLIAQPGQTVALAGVSGAGKSTILNLIPRFYDVTEGAVLVDGQDVRDVRMHSLREHIGLVSQETGLFDDTIRANIAYGKPNASMAEILDAAQAAAAHEFIAAFPDGYDTLVGEAGVRLSGGQRQRISIARAVLKNAPILLLDEATSALDNESERAVQAALEKLMQGRTTIVIAHRLSTIRNADIIYVMQDGQVAESGSHATLMARNGVYARLAASSGDSLLADSGESRS